MDETTGAEWADWERAFKSITQHSLSTRSRAKLFRMYAGITYTNKSYHRFGHKDSPQCTFCKEEKQTFTHLFLDCPGVEKFRKDLQRDWQKSLTKKDWFFGTDCDDLAYMIRESNLYLQAVNWKGKTLSKAQLYAQVCENEKIEASIATKRNKISEHVMKWQGRFTLMQLQIP